MPADTIAAIDARLAHMIVVRDQVITDAPLRQQLTLTEQWWESVDELLDRRLQLDEG
jgi:hypothetical protein